MKHLILKSVGWGSLMAVACLFSSCNDDELNSKELLVYTNAGAQNTINNQIIHTPVGSTGESKIGFPVCSTRELPADAEITFEVDESIVEAYNQEHKSNLQLIPGDLYTFSHSQVKIAAGKAVSDAPVQIELKDLSKLTHADGYILPLRMSQVTSRDKGLKASSNMNTVYVIIGSSYKYIDDTATGVEGTLVDKADWTATSSSVYGPFGAAFALDNNNATSWFFISSSTLTVDMQKVNTLKGLRLTPNYTVFNLSCYVGTVHLSFSKDGEEWMEQGELELSPTSSDSSVDSPDYKYVKLYAPAEARYVKIYAWAPATFGGFAEVDAIK